jgi:hypothetical protein
MVRCRSGIARGGQLADTLSARELESRLGRNRQQRTSISGITQNRTRGGYARIDQVTLSRHPPNGHFLSGLGFNLNVGNDSSRLNFVEKWFPGERLTVGLVKIPIL